MLGKIGNVRNIKELENWFNDPFTSDCKRTICPTGFNGLNRFDLS